MFKVGEKSESVRADRGGAETNSQRRRCSIGNQSTIVPDKLFCGIDVGAVSLAIAIQQREELIEERDFPNDANGHKLLIAWLRKRKASVRVTLEATGIYSLDLSFALNGI